MSLDLFPELHCHREFLGWDAPLLPRVCQYFLQNQRRGPSLDLSDWVCVLPTLQSAERFAELLRGLAQTEHLDFTAPKFLTSGDLAETLYLPEQPIAIEFEQTLAWARVLRQQAAESLRPLLPILPERDSLGAWLELAGTLRRLSGDLAAHDVDFADVVAASETDNERERWRLLETLFEAYQRELAAAGLSDPHEQRRRAIKAKKVRSKHRIALIGTVDLNESIANLLNAVDQDLVSFIAAPDERDTFFDSLGRLKTDAFASFQLPLSDDQLIPAGQIDDQACAVSEVVTQFASHLDTGDIAVGVTDESHVAPVEMQLEGCGFDTFRHIGWTVSRTGIGRLIDLTATFLARGTWRSLAALVRHGDVHRHLQSQMDSTSDDFLVSLDQMMANHLPVRLADPLPPAATEKYPQAIAVKDAVLRWLTPLIDGESTSPGSPKSLDTIHRSLPIAQWCVHILRWLESVSPSPGLSVDALAKVKELLIRFTKLSSHLDVPVSAASALEMLSSRLADLRVGRDCTPSDIQIHGWLDLALDDSPAMVVVGFNHPFVPSAVTSDPFLPGSLRSKLRVADNDRRYARDVYATQLILSTRQDVRLIVGRVSADGTPTPPSRLLAAAPPSATARRIRTLLAGSRPEVAVKHDWDTELEQTNLPIPQISVSECPVKTMSVTAFKAYLECPYRFYLRHVLKLKPVDDAARELAANQFGDLVHGAVEHFGESDDRDEPDERRILDALRHHLHEYAVQNYGDHVESAVRMQIHQAERRLQFVAAEQAKRIAQGWRIHATEESVNESEGACITVDGKKMGLRGRFDRIDRHSVTGQWAILDYKTHGHKPEKKHLRKNRETGQMEWIDLQLPLYRMMVPFLGIDAPPEEVQLGYFNVSDKSDETKINLAEFSESLMEQADQLIRQCVRRIFACDFTPTDGPVMYDDYEMILQTGVASRMLSGVSVGEEGES